MIEEWFPGAMQRVNESISRFSEAEILYRKAIDRERSKLLEARGPDFYISILKLLNTSPFATILYELLHPFGFSSPQVAQIEQLISSESGHYINSRSHRVIKNRDFLIITTLPAETTDMVVIDAFPCTIATHKFHFHFSVHEQPVAMETDATVALLDMKRLEFPLFLRKWKTGDYFYPLGMNMKKKKVSRVLINEKVPLHEKEHVYVLESNQKITWLAGKRLDERFRIRPGTEKILRVQMRAREEG